MANKRIYYACHRAGIAPNVSDGIAPTFVTIRGLQNIGVTTTFKLEQVFEMGQLDIYENIEGIPDIEVTTEKVIDGYCPIYLLATASPVNNGVSLPTSPTLVGRAPTQCILGVAIYEETLSQDTLDGVAEGQVGAEVHMSGLYVSALRYQVGVERNVTESVTFVGNNKVWVIGGDTGNFVEQYNWGPGTWDIPWNYGNRSPKAIDGKGGVQRRQDIIFDSGVPDGKFSVLPVNIPGITNLGGYSGINELNPDGSFGVHIQTWNVHTDLGREQLFELGRFGVYYRYVNWPVEVVNEITVISTSGDFISAAEEGIYQRGEGCGSRFNLTDNCIRLALCEGLMIDCGSKNKLRSVGMTGGDTGRGNVEVTYTYSNFNIMTVTHPEDPNQGLAR